MENRSLEICDPAEIPERVRDAFSVNGIRTFSYEGSVWARSGQWILRCPEGETEEQCLRDLVRTENHPDTPEKAWLEILNGCPEEQAESLARRFRLEKVLPSRVIVFVSRQENSAHMAESFRELAPLEAGDTLLSQGEGRMILIKRLRERVEEEVSDYASAMLETLESEAGLRCLCGIGNDAASRAELSRSYQEALQAIQTGIRFHLNAPVFLYEGQTLERVLAAIPEEKRQRLREEVFPPGAPLSAEMMETAQSFFRNDLNLTTTARELFIHRNTLLYRLERIRKETGLDVRSFHDAVIFKVLAEMPQ